MPALPSSRRLDAVACEVFAAELHSRSYAKRACKDGRVLVGEAVAEPARWIHGGETLTLLARVDPDVPPFDLPLEVVHDDDVMAVVWKPAGFPVSGNEHRTIAHALPLALALSSAADALVQPWPAHRLDAPTSGLLVVGKTRRALAALNRAFEERAVQKRYRAFVVGRLEGEGVIDSPIDGRAARTRWEASGFAAVHKAGVSDVRLWPETGRTHQLRQHLAALGHPVLGDKRYGIRGHIYRSSGLFLCATGLRLEHPETGEELVIDHEPAAKFSAYWRRALVMAAG